MRSGLKCTDQLVVRVPALLSAYILLALLRDTNGCTSRKGKRGAVLVLLAIDWTRYTPFVEFFDLLAVTEDAPGDGEDKVEGHDHDHDARNDWGVESHAPLGVRLGRVVMSMQAAGDREA